MQNPNPPIINPLPAAAILLVLPMIAFEIFFAGASAGLWGSFSTRFEVLDQTAYVSDIFERSWVAGQMSWSVVARFFTYSFVNSTLLQAAFAIALTLALAKFVAEALGSLQTLVVFFVSAALSALLYGIIMQRDVALFGAFEGIFGLLGAYTFIMFSHANGVAERQMKAFQLLAVLMAINVVFGAFFGGGFNWVAELIAAIVGFGCALVLRPHGIAILLHNIRRR